MRFLTEEIKEEKERSRKKRRRVQVREDLESERERTVAEERRVKVGMGRWWGGMIRRVWERKTRVAVESRGENIERSRR